MRQPPDLSGLLDFARRETVLRRLAREGGWLAALRAGMETADGALLEHLEGALEGPADGWPAVPGLRRDYREVLAALMGAARAARAAPQERLAQLRHPPGGVADPDTEPGRFFGWLATLRGAPVRAAVTVPVAVVEGAAGRIGGFTCELLAAPWAGVFRDPEDLLAGRVDAAFAGAVRDAWAVVFGDEPVLVRWRVRLDGRVPPEIGGDSAGAAVTIAMARLRDGGVPDPHLLATAAVEPASGRLRRVEGVTAKLRAAVARPDIDTVVVCPDNEVEARRALSGHDPPRLVVAATVADLLAVRSALVEELLDYFARVIAWADALPAPLFPQRLRQGGFPRLRQRVRLVEDRDALRRQIALELERRRRAGLPEEGLAARPWREVADGPEVAEREAERRARPVDWEEAAERHPQAAVLGDPGYGKSWLLRHEARRRAEAARQALLLWRCAPEELELPLLARLPDLAREAGARPDADLAALVLARAVGLEGAGGRLRAFLGEAVRSGRAVLLLDALDEVPVERPPEGEPVAGLPGFRQDLRARIAAHLRAHPACRLVLSSRIVGWEPFPSDGPVELELLAFGPEEVEAFAHAWFTKQEERAGKFLAALRGSARLSGLARIPLLLTLLCRAFEGEGALPERRVELYERALSGLLGDWAEADKARPVGAIELRRWAALASELALALLGEGLEQFSPDDLLDHLDRIFAAGGRVPTRDPEGALRRFEADGLLVRLGEDREAPRLFLHRSLQEYLAARALAGRANTEGFEAIRELVDRRSWDPAWHEVVVLLAGLLDDPAPLLELLADEERDDILHHRLVLAGRCLGEIAPALRPKLVHRAEKVADRFAKVWGVSVLGRDVLRERAGPAFRLVRSVAKVARPRSVRLVAVQALGALALRTSIAAFFSLSPPEGPEIYWLEAATLAGLGPAAAMPEVLAALVAALRDWDAHMRMVAAEALGKLGPAAATPEVLAALVEVVLRDRVQDVRRAAAEALGKLGPAAATPEVLAALAEAVLRNEDSSVLAAALWALRRLDPAAVREVIAAWRDGNGDMGRAAICDAAASFSPRDLMLSFLFLFFESEEKWASLVEARSPADFGQLVLGLCHGRWRRRYLAARELAACGPAAATPEVLAALVGAVLRDRARDVRRAAAYALGSLGPAAATPEVLAALVGAVLRDRARDARRAAAYALGSLGPAAATPEVLAALVGAVLRDRARDVRRAAAKALGALGPRAVVQDVTAKFVEALKDEFRGMREAAAYALGSLGPGAATPEVLAALVGAVLRDRDRVVRRAAAKALGALGPRAVVQDVTAKFVEALKDEFWGMREAAAYALGSLGPGAATPEVLAALVEAVLRDRDRVVRRAAAEALGSLGPAAATPEVLAALVEAVLHDRDRVVRRAAAEALGSLGPAAATPEVLVVLRRTLRDRDVLAHREAAQALAAWSRAGLRVFVRRTWFGWKKTYVVRRVEELAA